MAVTLTLLLFLVSFLELCAYSSAEAPEKHNPSDLQRTCNQILAAISGASQVFFPREYVTYSLVMLNVIGNQAAPEYSFDTLHTYSSSSEASACSVEPGSADDVSKIVS